MSPRKIITLVTDFGTRDGYVGAMKGVIASRAPDATVVDITHDIAPQSLREGGFAWRVAASYFPPGTVHVAVVDPGVGSRRRIVAIRANGQIYLAPDDGLASYAMEKRAIRGVRTVKNRELFLSAVSDTFHGRDIFAPVAAALACGDDWSTIGPELPKSELVWPGIPSPRSRVVDGERIVRGEVIHVDRFGNLVTNVRAESAGDVRACELGERSVDRVVRSYRSASNAEPVLIEGSLGFLEIAVRDGSAAEVTGEGVGARVRVRRLPRKSFRPADGSSARSQRR